MPSCFQLYRKGDTEPTVLQRLDEELCHHFEQPVHPTEWFRAWYHTIGLGLATGSDWNRLRNTYQDRPELLEIIDYLETNFTPNAWYER